VSGAAFADVPRTPRGHLGLLFYEAAFTVVAHVRARAGRSGQPPEQVFEQFPSLADYVSELRRRMPDGLEWEECGRWLRAEIDEWETEADPSWPLPAVARDLALGRDAPLLLALLGLVEEDAAFAALFAALQAPLAHRRPTLGLLGEIAQVSVFDAPPDAWSLCHPLVAAGLAEVVNADAPRSEWTLRVPPPIWTAIRGDRPAEPMTGLTYRGADTAPAIDDLIVSEPLRERLRQVQRFLEAGRARTLVVRGMGGSERLELVAALAASIGLGVMEAAVHNVRDERLTRLGPLATLMRAVPVFAPELGPSESFTVPTLAGYAGPIVVILGREGGIGGAAEAVTIEVPPDTVSLRRQHWARALDVQAADVPAIAETFALSGRYIRQCAPLAAVAARLEGRPTVSVADVRQASRAINRQVLEALASPIEATGGWDQLVVNAETESELRDLERRCRHRERLAATFGAGFPGGLNRGVRVLFEGPSGTGKTLAARVVAAQVGLDLYRVDLASVINKYIGETEKNLSRILSRAEDLDVILLLDEGDALLSRRTDVRSSNDRYANLETNYLLQRLETYDGICIVTTNLGAHIDPAFRRRMDVVARFHLPDAEQRWRLWQLHLPADHALDPGTLEEVALRYSFSGGQVRNAALYAALSAIGRGGRVAREDVLSAIELEHRKAGASFPRQPAATPRDGAEGLDRFVSLIS
jgi:ATPase family associated with various cellular activities (AAA)